MKKNWIMIWIIMNLSKKNVINLINSYIFTYPLAPKLMISSLKSIIMTFIKPSTNGPDKEFSKFRAKSVKQ